MDRLLEKGYRPQNIILEKTWASGHGRSGRLDVCVTRDDGSEYLLIECKTYGKEFIRALKKIHKNGGQLFTYFKFSNKADVIMLYTSELQGNSIVYENRIIKIEDEYRVGDVADFYEKWNKLPKDNGVFDFPIHNSLKDNIKRVKLVDMLTFDRANFEKNISTAARVYSLQRASKYNMVRLGEVCETQIKTKFVYLFLRFIQDEIYGLQRGQA